MEQCRRDEAAILIKKVLQEKSFLILTENEKELIIDSYSDEMKIESKNYDKYLSLSLNEKLTNIVLFAIKEYLGSWHVSSDEMKEISEYMKEINKN